MLSSYVPDFVESNDQAVFKGEIQMQPKNDNLTKEKEDAVRKATVLSR